MFITKSRHQEVVKLLETSAAQQQAMAFNQIESLKSQIQDLKKLIFVPKRELEPQDMEVDAVLSGSDKPIEISEEEHNRLLEQSREADMLISGNYAEDLMP